MNHPSPEHSQRRLLDFLGIQASDGALAELAAQIRSPRTRNRYQQHPWRDDFSEPQLQRLAALGYTAEMGEAALS